MPDDFSAAVSSAVAESTKEAGGESTPAPDPTPTPEPAAPTPEAKPEEPKAEAKPEPPDENEEFWTPTAEELAAIDKNPELKKVYRSMQKGLTQKTTALATKRKELEQSQQVVEWIRADPETAIRTIASATGVTLSQAKQATEEKVADSLEAEWVEKVGPDAAKILRPLFEQTAKRILEQEVAPYRAQTEQLAQAAAQRGIAASVAEFGASVTSRGEEWDDETQAEMAKLANVVEPGANTPINEYLGVLYDTVMANRMRTKSARANLERLRRVRTEAEPAGTARSAPVAEERVETSMSDKDAVAVAVRLAKQGLGMR